MSLDIWDHTCHLTEDGPMIDGGWHTTYRCVLRTLIWSCMTWPKLAVFDPVTDPANEEVLKNVNIEKEITINH